MENMTKLSRYTDPRHMGWFINNFWTAVTLLEDKEEVKSFLKGILTHTEMKMFAKRLQIAKMLIEGYDYGTIRSYVRVGDETIARINNLLEARGDEIKRVIGKLQEIERKRERELEPSDLIDIKKKYPQYFWPEKVFEAIEELLKRRKKRKSAEKI